jgi:chromosomal replication initiation ATPase DnaA
VREIESPWEALKWQTALGRENFLQRLKDQIKARSAGDREVPALREVRLGKAVEPILQGVAKAYGCAREDLLRRGKKGNEARAVAMTMIWDACGMSLAEVGQLFGGAQYTAVAQMIARTRVKDREKKLRFKLATLVQECVK